MRSFVRSEPQGLGKRVSLSDFTVRSRNAKGNLAIRIKSGGDCVVGFRVVEPAAEDPSGGDDGGSRILIASARGNLNLIAAASVALQRPYGMGVALMNLAEDDVVASIDGVESGGRV